MQIKVSEKNSDVKEFRVLENQHGIRLDKYLSLLIPEFSRSYLQKLIESGDVWVDKKVCNSAAQKLSLFQIITINLRLPPQMQAYEAENLPLNVIYEDEHLLVINKHAGMVMHPAAGNWSGTLLQALLNHHAQASSLPRAGIVHRLDKDTSGVCVVGKTLQTTLRLTTAIAERRVKRVYLAIVHGNVGSNQFTIDQPVGRDLRMRTRMAVVAAGKSAKTDVAVLKRALIEKALFTGICCNLHTGRTHQIRVHLANMGFPLVSDSLYGGKFSLEISRQALHARSLSFHHPITDSLMTFEAELPIDFMNAWGILDKHLI
jgi:23S rRNA pseudouridine1911/1915/1917 synthase